MQRGIGLPAEARAKVANPAGAPLPLVASARPESLPAADSKGVHRLGELIVLRVNKDGTCVQGASRFGHLSASHSRPRDGSDVFFVEGSSLDQIPGRTSCRAQAYVAENHGRR